MARCRCRRRSTRSGRSRTRSRTSRCSPPQSRASIRTIRPRCGAPRVDFGDALALAPDVRGMRIACLAPEQFPAYIDDEVVRARHAAIDVLRDLGAQVEDVRAPIDFDDDRRARRQDPRRRSLRVPSRLHRGPEAADRPVGAQARARRQVDQRRRLHRRPDGDAPRAGGVRGVDARARRAVDAHAADHRAARRGRRRGDGAAGDVHARGELSRLLRAVAPRGIFSRGTADRRATGRRAVRGSRRSCASAARSRTRPTGTCGGRRCSQRRGRARHCGETRGDARQLEGWRFSGDGRQKIRPAPANRECAQVRVPRGA